MRKIRLIFIISLLLSFCQMGFAQLRGINYQAVAIDENGVAIAGVDLNGQPINNAAISVRFSILSGSSAGAILYQVTYTTNTDQYGLFSLIIGDGNVTGAGQYQHLIDVPWAAANQFLKVEIDIYNKGDFKVMSVQQFMAVPYAFYTSKSDTASYAFTTGTSGTFGATGSIGSTGTTGITGTTGSIGFTGTTGYPGLPGSPRSPGTTGSIGGTGATGDIGGI